MATNSTDDQELLTQPVVGPLLYLNRPEVKISDAISAGEQIAGRLRALSDSIGPDSNDAQFYRRIRVKHSQSLRDKVRRKRTGGVYNGKVVKARPLYSYRDLTDIVGFRLVTLYDEDLHKAVDHILELVKIGQKQGEPLFVGDTIWDSFVEAHFYLRGLNAENNIYVKCHAALVERLKKDCCDRPNLGSLLVNHVKAIAPPATGEQYSSGHFIFNAVGYSNGRRLVIPVEFQLRTAIEDIWSEINHTLLYKIQSQYVWNHDFEDYLKKATLNSKALKNATDAFPDLIAPFYSASQSASDQIRTFSDPGVDQHYSLCIALFSNVGTRSVEPFISLFTEYETILRALPQTESRRARAEALDRGIGVIERVKQKVGEHQRKLRPGTIEYQVDQQRIHLCDLEMIRLRILMVVSCRYLRAGGSLISLAGEDKAARKEWARKSALLFKQLCDYRSDETLKIRPIAMLHYWKFYVAQAFDEGVARQNLESGYLELNADGSLPFYSIYRILFPRLIAATMLMEVKTTVENLSRIGADAGVLHGLATTLKAKLVQAFGYALEAFRLYLRPHVNRGDLIFGHEVGEPFRDASTILNIYRVFRNTFDISILESKQVDARDILHALTYLQESDLGALKGSLRKELEVTMDYALRHLPQDIRDWEKKT